ncbi:xylose ABC transporter ATP-binding protein [Tepidibacter formicigenes]|jgi:D-xylose transport system ATP-binding protein|uniref:Xylose ABC transporter ATP-binding protein n=1 Tax=Tepidibacter formicigenes DSM 15518 TaxID=1123349 RepID=A0A1M6NFA5_9FIRM|nr:xylose ABC transporter ATP-binding protein [Tepidibacter formicigenes]SHJ94370.1 xylose ABC transporter ATP-binding protein [Tepidibacter formicigenes DSM 15518]
MSEYILEMRGITKEFPGVKALDNVNFKVKKGEVHALCGENGAGKSTLMKVLSGVYPYGSYSGDIVLKDEVQKFYGIKDSEKKKIAIVYQELALVPQMTVAENIYLANEPLKFGSTTIDDDKLNYMAKDLIDRLGLNINPSTKVGTLGVGIQQLVEIAKALSKDVEVLILDEPTAALTESEVETLFRIIKELKKTGITFIIITHKLEEIFEIADTVTILRDGQTISSHDIEELDEDKIIQKMVGRELTERYPKVVHKGEETILEVKNFTVYDPNNPDKKLVDDVSFNVKKGEILGISGLVGAGRTELIMGIFGAYGKLAEGEIYLENNKVEINSPMDAIKNGLALVTEDRKGNGLVLSQSIMVNTTLASLDKVLTGGILDENKEIYHTNKYVDELKTKTPHIEQKVGNLSGGNQQKVVLAKWLMTEPKILFLDEPTRGIDVGAKYEIYNIMNQLVEKGVAVVMISSELPEILGMSDRILVMHEGKIKGELNYEDATQEEVMYFATGRRSEKNE